MAAQTAESKKGENVVVLDMRHVTLVADYFVIISALNVIQVESIADAIEDALGQAGVRALRRIGGPRAHWIVLDYGGVVVHVFTVEERAYYNLERLWGDAQLIDHKALSYGITMSEPRPHT
ncbi:MAG: ribosome silencing factor [Firmicutes bacterium]|nr:ribosome silencing factor [Bacillota bacterium]